MKKMMMTMMALLVLTSTAMASSSTKLIDTSEAVTSALTAFEKDNDPATVDLFKGIRAAPGEGGVTVTVYLTGAAKQEYSCHRHEDADPFECHQAD